MSISENNIKFLAKIILDNDKNDGLHLHYGILIINKYISIWNSPKYEHLDAKLKNHNKNQTKLVTLLIDRYILMNKFCEFMDNKFVNLCLLLLKTEMDDTDFLTPLLELDNVDKLIEGLYTRIYSDNLFLLMKKCNVDYYLGLTKIISSGIYNDILANECIKNYIMIDGLNFSHKFDSKVAKGAISMFNVIQKNKNANNHSN